MVQRIKAAFIEPMLLLRTEALPDEPARWEYQLKFDGYRAIAFKTGGRLSSALPQRQRLQPPVSGGRRGLAKLPDETVIDGEIVALDGDGRRRSARCRTTARRARRLSTTSSTSWSWLGATSSARRSSARRDLLEQQGRAEARTSRCGTSGHLEASLQDLIHSVKAQGLEGLVAKRRDSRYEPGLRSGAWMKMRINRGQEFVIGGYTLGTKTFDALIFGYYEGDRLIYAARTRNGFTPADARSSCSRSSVRWRSPIARSRICPETKSGRWGARLDQSEDGGLPLAEADSWSGSSSSWNGPATTTCGTRGSSACAKTNPRGRRAGIAREFLLRT